MSDADGYTSKGPAKSRIVMNPDTGLPDCQPLSHLIGLDSTEDLRACCT